MNYISFHKATVNAKKGFIGMAILNHQDQEEESEQLDPEIEELDELEYNQIRREDWEEQQADFKREVEIFG